MKNIYNVVVIIGLVVKLFDAGDLFADMCLNNVLAAESMCASGSKCADEIAAADEAVRSQQSGEAYCGYFPNAVIGASEAIGHAGSLPHEAEGVSLSGREGAKMCGRYVVKRNSKSYDEIAVRVAVEKMDFMFIRMPSAFMYDYNNAEYIVSYAMDVKMNSGRYYALSREQKIELAIFVGIFGWSDSSDVNILFGSKSDDSRIYLIDLSSKSVSRGELTRMLCPGPGTLFSPVWVYSEEKIIFKEEILRKLTEIKSRLSDIKNVLISRGIGSEMAGYYQELWFNNIAMLEEFLVNEYEHIVNVGNPDSVSFPLDLEFAPGGDDDLTLGEGDFVGFVHHASRNVAEAF